MIDAQTVAHIAMLARLRFSPAEAEKLRGDLAGILNYVAQLGAVNVDGVEPTAHALPVPNTFRDDEPLPSLPRSVVMALSPDRVAAQEGFFAVPTILEDLADESAAGAPTAFNAGSGEGE